MVSVPVPSWSPDSASVLKHLEYDQPPKDTVRPSDAADVQYLKLGLSQDG